MINIFRITIFFSLLILSGCVSETTTEAPDKPNIIVILADDMGYSDISCYGSEIQTPNIDQLAGDGVKFTQFYNTGRCCPSRTSLLTGMYSHRAGVGHMAADYELPAYRGFITDSALTIAEALKPAGYKSYMIGKWHVGTEKPHWPLQRGFDKFYGSNTSQGHYFRILENRKLIYDNQELESVPDGWYATNAFTDSAIAFIQRHRQEQKDQPFFLYLAYTAPHWPIHALEEDIALYEGKYLGGYDSVREARYQRMLEMGLVKDAWSLSAPHEKVLSWSEVDQQEEDRRMAVYAAMIHRMDAGIGKLTASVNKLGIEENTIILFLSDNGGCAEVPGKNYPRIEGAAIGSPDSYEGVQLPWANVNNTPYRYFKQYVHEGGISTPLIIKYPREITQPGIVNHIPGHITDLMPTFLQLAGLQYDQVADPAKHKTLDGMSIFPLEQFGKEEERVLFWEHQGHQAVRKGNYKLVRLNRQPWELYDLDTDRSELNDLSESQPEKKEELLNLYLEWSGKNQVLPFDSVMVWRQKAS